MIRIFFKPITLSKRKKKLEMEILNVKEKQGKGVGTF